MNKTLKYYMSLPYSFVLYPDEKIGGYTVSYPDLPGCLSVGDTLEEACINAEDAKKEWLIAAIEDGTPICEPKKMASSSGQFKLRLPKSLHQSLKEHSREEGISLNQYCLYLLSKNDAVYR